MRTLNLFITVSAVALVGSAGLAHADRYELGVGSAARWMPSSSTDALSEDDMAAYSLSGARTLPLPGLFGFELLGEGSFEYGSLEGTSFARVDSDTSTLLFMGGVRARRPVLSRWMVGARASLGLARIDTRMQDSFTDSLAITDGAWTPAMYLGAGVDYTPIRQRDAAGAERFALGMRAELGYLAMPGVSMAGEPERMDEDDIIRIPAVAAGLGDLDMSAVTLRIALISRF